MKVANEAVLIDAPPVKLEVQFQVPVMLENGEFRPLSDLSPVVQTLATQQFDDVVKRVRVFVAPELRESVPPVWFKSSLDAPSNNSSRRAPSFPVSLINILRRAKD